MISVIIPVREKKEDIGSFLKSLVKDFKKYLDDFEVIISENSKGNQAYSFLESLSSQDKELNQKTVLLKTSFPGGIKEAVLFGINQSKGDFVCVVCADLADRIEDIKKMKERAEKEKAGVVIGNRNYSFLKGRANRLSFKSIFSIVGSIFISKLLGFGIHDLTNSFRVYRREILDKVIGEKFISTGREFSYELLLKLIKYDVKISEIHTVWKERKKGHSNFSMFDVFSYIYLTYWFIRKKI